MSGGLSWRYQANELMSSVKAIVMKVRKRIEKIVEAQLTTLERVLISHSLEMLVASNKLIGRVSYFAKRGSSLAIHWAKYFI
jgi:hypothetical protein